MVKQRRQGSKETSKVARSGTPPKNIPPKNIPPQNIAPQNIAQNIDDGNQKKTLQKAALLAVVCALALILFGISLASSIWKDEEMAQRKMEKKTRKWPESQSVRLHNGVEMPRIGFGTAGMRGELTRKSVRSALDAGFRFFDGAEATEWYDDYSLGMELAEAIRNGKVERSDLFISTKLHPKNLGTENTKKALREMRKTLQTDYLDLVLIHFPICGEWIHTCQGLSIEGTWQDTWRVFEEEYEDGLIRSIGISNFDSEEIEQVIEFAKIKPHVVQNWMDPFHIDKGAREICKAHDIAYTSYSTLGGQWEYRGPRKNLVFTSKAIESLAESKKASIPQVVLSWALQNDVVVIPRSTNVRHIQANAKLLDPASCEAFFLEEESLKVIDALALE